MDNIYEHFHKDIITSCPLISPIFGADCDVQGSNIVINDFVNHTSTPTCQLTIYQVLEIHRRNKNNSHRFRFSTHYSTDNILGGSTEVINNFCYDELYEIYSIFEDRSFTKQERLKKQSTCLYSYLTAVLGTERIFTVRALYADLSCHTSRPGISSITAIGSKAEGFDLPWSDSDYLFQVFCLLENNLIGHEKTWITYNSLRQDVHPGYVVLEGENGNYLKNNAMHGILKGEKSLFVFTRQGPASSFSKENYRVDYVHAFKSLNWPSVANEWVTRKRRYGWPSKEIITTIIVKGCHIVPKSSDRRHENEKEWRLSFSLAEKYLIRTFNQTQRMIYGLLKILIKQYVSKRTVNDPDLLCSYFVKTVMMWVIEENPQYIWVPENSIYCYHICLKRLIHFVKEENCPNYFVPKNNMFSTRFREIRSTFLLQLLYDTLLFGFSWTVHIDILSNISSGLNDIDNQNNRVAYTAQVNEEIEEFLISQARLPTLTVCLFNNANRAKRFFKLKAHTQRLVPHFCHFLHQGIGGKTNKKAYILKKLIVKFLTMNKHDKYSYVLLASFLLDESLYEECLTALELASRIMPLEKYRNVVYNTSNIEEKVLINSNKIDDWSFSNQCLLVPIDSHLIPHMKMLSYHKVKLKIYNCLVAALPFDLYILSLKFVCFHKLNYVQRRDGTYATIKALEYKDDALMLLKCMTKIFCNLVKSDINLENVVYRLFQSPGEFGDIMSILDMTASDVLIFVNFLKDTSESIDLKAFSDIAGFDYECWCTVAYDWLSSLNDN